MHLANRLACGGEEYSPELGGVRAGQVAYLEFLTCTLLAQLMFRQNEPVFSNLALKSRPRHLFYGPLFCQNIFWGSLFIGLHDLDGGCDLHDQDGGCGLHDPNGNWSRKGLVFRTTSNCINYS